MDGEYCLDTNIAAAALNGHREVKRRMQVARLIVLPFPVVGELLFGAAKSARSDENLQAYRRFIDAAHVQQSNPDTMEVYARVKLQLQRQGTPLPENDIWIAACALHLGLPLVTHDQHFQHLPQLPIENWLG